MKYLPYIALFSALSFGACKLEELPDIATPTNVDFEMQAQNGADAQACPFVCTIQFSNATTPSSITDFEWDFGFEVPEDLRRQRDPLVTFPDVATSYSVKLTAFNDRGEEVGSKTRNVTVIDPTAEPEPNFTIANDGCFARCSVVLTNSSNNATRFVWDFGDEGDTLSTDSFDPIEHSYPKPGSYTVKLTAFNGPDGEEKMEEIEKTVTVNMRTFEDSQPGKGAGKAVRQRADGGYVVVGNTGVSGGNIYIMHTVPGGAKEVDTTFVVAETLGDITVADVIFFNDESVGIIGTVKDNAISRNRLVYALIDKDGSPLVAPVMLSEGHPDFEDRSVTVQRLLAVAGDRLAAIGEAIDINDGSSTLYIKVFDRNLISQQPGVLLGDPGGGSCFVYDAVRMDGQLVIGTAVDDGGLVGKLFVTDDFGSPEAGFPKVIDSNYRGITGLVEGGDGNPLRIGFAAEQSKQFDPADGCQ